MQGFPKPFQKQNTHARTFFATCHIVLASQAAIASACCHDMHTHREHKKGARPFTDICSPSVTLCLVAGAASGPGATEMGAAGTGGEKNYVAQHMRKQKCTFSSVFCIGEGADFLAQLATLLLHDLSPVAIPGKCAVARSQSTHYPGLSSCFLLTAADMVPMVCTLPSLDGLLVSQCLHSKSLQKIQCVMTDVHTCLFCRCAPCSR